VNRGDVYDVEFEGGRRPAVIVTRDVALPVLANVCVVDVTSTVRGLVTEVPLGPAQGLSHECAANCDNISTIPKWALGRRRGVLGPADLHRLRAALRIALDLD
jgi:mRNA interferase MazF